MQGTRIVFSDQPSNKFISLFTSKKNPYNPNSFRARLLTEYVKTLGIEYQYGDI
jgi:hypothetical protein